MALPPIRCIPLCALFALLPLGARSQTIHAGYWKLYRQRADSVVISRIGKDMFECYVFTEERIRHDLSDLIIVTPDSLLDWSDRDRLTAPPLYCAFEYELCLDPDEGGPTIRFALDPTGHLVPGEGVFGLPTAGIGRNGLAMPIKDFERIAHAKGFHWDRTDRYRMLGWAPSEGALPPYDDGTYELTLGRVIGHGAEYAHRSAYLFDIIEGIVFDVFTGEVRRAGIFQISTGIACGGTL